MKKLLSFVLLALFASSVFAYEGHGYKIIERKVTVSPGIEAYSIPVDAKKKHLLQQQQEGQHSMRLQAQKTLLQKETSRQK